MKSNQQLALDVLYILWKFNPNPTHAVSSQSRFYLRSPKNNNNGFWLLINFSK